MHTLDNDQMHGSIFIFPRRFVENSRDYSTWGNLLEREGLRDRIAESFLTIQEAKTAVFVYMGTFCNRQRKHAARSYLTYQ